MNESIMYYPLTHPQLSIWYTEKLHPNISIWNMCGTLKIKGEIEYPLLEKAINLVIEKNDSLRLRIVEKDNGFFQYVSQYNYYRLNFFDFSGQSLDKLYEWDTSQTHSPFYKFDSDLFYFALIKINKTSRIYIKVHHIMSDAWSMVMLASEVMRYYNILRNGSDINESNKPSYIEYILEEERYKNSNRFYKDKEFWNEKFKIIPDLTTLKVSKANEPYIRAKRETFIIPARLSLKIREYCRDNKASIFMLFLAALSMYINRITSKDDLVFGTLVLNRSNAREKEMMGMFMSIAPIRVKVDNSSEFVSFVSDVTKEWMSVLRHQKYPFDLLLHDLREANKGVEKLYDIVLSYQNAKLQKTEIDDSYEGRWHFCGYQTVPLCININDREDDGNIMLDFDYLSDLFYSKEIEFIHDHLMRLLWHALDNPHKEISRIEMISEKEKQKILYKFNNTQTDYPREKTIHQLFEEQVKRTPKNIALVFEDKQLTYRELNNNANRLARTLREKGVKPDSVVGLMVRRSPEMIIGILGILKAGGAFLPCDPELPDERIKFMLEDSKADILITNSYCENRIDFTGSIVNIDNKDIYNKIGTNLSSANKASDLAYVIYTSGSTGNPKGVMIEHKSLNNFLHGVYNFLDFSPGIPILSITTMSFDVFIFETIPSIVKGLKVVIANEEQQKIPKLLGRLITLHKIEKVIATPSRIQLLVEDEESKESIRYVKEIIVGGEVISERLLEKLELLTNARIFNNYGPTETTIGVTFKEITDNKEVNIGKPMANTKIYILDRNMNPLPIGVSGEMYISGDSVGRGYLNRLQLTEERFIPSPFNQSDIIYRTGDLARWFPEGEIEFLGRIDQQVKIRGYRIELSEIENQILNYKNIEEAVVIDRIDSDGNKFLCAYVVSKNSIQLSELRAFLYRQLPKYMIPTAFIQITQIPLTYGGKIDRNALPEPQYIMESNSDYIAPSNEMESRLADIWCKILRIDKIGIKDNIFNLGADSMDIISFITQTSKEFNVEFPIAEVYNAPTIEELKNYILSSEKSFYIPIEPAEDQLYYPLSSSQKRLYILTQIEGNNTVYNMPWISILQGRLDRHMLEKAFNSLVQRHDAFRTSFKLIDGNPVQIISKSIKLDNIYGEIEESNIENTVSAFIRPFDLSKAPLIRVKLLKISEEKHLFLFDMHHIVSDGVSSEILLDEFDRLYKGEVLTELRLQYRDYSVWQNQILKSDFMKRQEDFWLGVFSGEIPTLSLPCDFVRPNIKSYEGDVIDFRIGKQLTKRLRKLMSKTGTTLYMILLAAYNILLSKYCGQEDIVVGCPAAGRRHPDVENLLGIFINILPMRNFPIGGSKFSEFLEHVKQKSLKAYENQDYPFEELVDNLKIKRNLSRNPLFDTMFILQSINVERLNIGNLNATPYKYNHKIAKFDLLLEAIEIDEHIKFSLEYCTKLFKKSTIKRMINSFVSILKTITQEPSVRLLDIDVLSQNEKHQLLYEFNNTKADYPSNKTIHQLFEKQAEKSPEAIAVVYGDKSLTYNQLNEKSDKLACVLRSKGVTRNSIVGIMVKRSLEMIIGIMGILKAGGAYLPLDPDNPRVRTGYIIKDSGMGIILTQHEYIGSLQTDIDVVDLEDSSIYMGENKTLDGINKAEDLAYVIYTSGSTGNPKGVMIEHRSVINMLNWVQNKYKMNEDDVILQKTPYTFDVSVWELFCWSLAGARLCFLSPGGEKDPGEIIDTVERNKVTVMHFVPSMLSIFLEFIEHRRDVKRLSCVKSVFAIGEALSVQLVEKFNKILNSSNGTKLYNLYGPTEATVEVSYYDCPEKGEIEIVPIGKPIDNIRLYILDKNYRLQPIGVPGEICIAGVGVGRGYLNRSELTAEKFTQDPFFKGERMYKTGDIGIWLPDGNLRYLGRTDHQVKIRGMRIELDEIEKQLLMHEKVKQAVVIDREGNNGRRFLCAYVVMDSEIPNLDLNKFLSKYLPEYMIPSYFIKLGELPLTSSGKMDKKTLPMPETSVNDIDETVKPESEIEKKLVQIFSEVLNIEKIGVNQNLFELGADSLSIITIQTKTFQYEWGLTIQDFYKHQTIRELSDKIEEKLKGCNVPGVDDMDIIDESIQEVAAGMDITYEKGCIDNVLLTGATGFLGIHILHDLLSYTSAIVHCLMRDESKEASEKRLQKLLDFYFKGKYKELINNRIYIVNGDITQDKLGLGDEDYDALGDNIDIIVHTAAKVEHIGMYQEFKRVNVLGTGNMIDFSLKYNKLLYHISTMSVSGTSVVNTKVGKTNFTEKDFYIGQNYSDNVYVKSKFEAERLIFEAIAQGLNAVVCRVGNLTGRYSDGHFQINMDKNAFYNRIKSIVELGAVPDVLLEQPVEFTPVDCCSKAIVEIIKYDKPVSNVLHLFNNKYVSFSDFVNMLASMGIKVKAMGNQSFTDYIRDVSKNRDKQQLLKGIIQDINEKKEIDYKSLITVDSHITREFFRKMEFDWPKIDIGYIKKVIFHMTDQEYLFVNV